MLVLALLLGCNNDCSYFERCDGQTLLVCGESADQQVNRKVNEVPCEAPNAVCVEVGDDNATCAYEADACAAGAAAACEGDILVTCDPFQSSIGLLGDGTEQSFAQGADCAAAGMICGAEVAEGPVACIAAE